MKFFYACYSAKDQNEARQLAYAKELSLSDARIFIDTGSGENANRPALQDLLSRLREGDEIHINELSRLGRNTRDLLELMDKFEQMKVELHSKKEAIDTTTPAGRLVFHIFASVAEFQRQIILENARERREAAKKQGKPISRPKVDQNSLSLALHMFQYDKGKSIAEVCSKTGIGRSTLYRIAEERGINRTPK